MNSISKKMKEAKKLVQKMTIEEKASLLSGKTFWDTKSVERLGVNSYMVTDGPHGLRKQAGESDHLGLNESVPATCFPTASITSCSFDRELYYQLGEALGAECLKNNVAVLLGPAINIKRSPLCGRNFEYLSEDPFLTGELASQYVNGVQSKNIGVSVKHYLANSQEKRRFVSNSIVDERALREIYLSAFETVIKKSQPWTLMCAYNLINDVYASDNKLLMTKVPREEWGYEGAIMTDWGAMNNRVTAVEAGLDLEMPSSGGVNDKLIVKAVNEGKLEEKYVDICAERMTAIALMNKECIPEDFDEEKHNELARKIGRESAVLLRNEGNALPIDKKAKVAVIGEFAQKPRYQGAGSSHINPIKITNICDELKKNNIDYKYAKGYDAVTGKSSDEMINEAVKIAKDSDKAIVLVGLTDAYESEGYDRDHINMPDDMNKLVEKVSQANKNTIVVVMTGSSIFMPWRESVKGILLVGLTGQNNGGVIYDLVFGDYCPSGKLSETYPLSEKDSLSYLNFAKDDYNVLYKESIFVGYRYYDSVDKEVQYPFGYGLSYTKFEYSDIKLSSSKIKDTDNLKVSLKVKNIGKREGKEIVQLYVSSPKSGVFKPIRELKEFAKISLKAGESKVVEFELNKRSFAFYNVNINDWCIESGDYKIEIGASSRHIRLSETVNISNTDKAKLPEYTSTAPIYYSLPKDSVDISDKEFEAVLGRSIPAPPPKRPFTLNSTLGDLQAVAKGRLLVKVAKKVAKKQLGGGKENEFESSDLQKMVDAMLIDLPIRGILMIAGGKINHRQLKGFVTLMDGKFFKGLGMMLTKNRESKS